MVHKVNKPNGRLKETKWPGTKDEKETRKTVTREQPRS